LPGGGQTPLPGGQGGGDGGKNGGKAAPQFKPLGI